MYTARCVSSRHVSKVHFGWLEIIAKSGGGVEHMAVDLTVEEPIGVEIFFENDFIRRTHQLDAL